MHRTRSGRRESGRAPSITPAGASWAGRIAIVGVSWILAADPGIARSEVYYVDNGNPACSSDAPGTLSEPYCTITDAVDQHGGPGVTIIVRPGTYRETVDMDVAGTADAPFAIQADGPDVIVDGADRFASPALWAQYSPTVYLLDSFHWDPSQVFVDGTRLENETGTSPDLLTPGSFGFVPGKGLYVNIGGDNPGTHETLIGMRNSGFGLWEASNITIRGFHVTRCEDRGIQVDGAAHCNLLENRVDFCYSNGLHVTKSSSIMIAGNTILDNCASGIALVRGTTGCTVQDNESGRNADPLVRVANGLYLYRAPFNLIQRNRYHHNQDSGQHLQTASDSCISIQNRSWSNGDHGFDQLEAVGTLHVGDVAWGNHMDGFSIEGEATGTQLFNCIAAENGLTTGRFDLWVENSSTVGFVSDYNIFWNSTSQPPVKYETTLYASVAAYSENSGHDEHSLQMDPGFVNPAAGDFNLLEGSPAIDSGNSSVPDWPSTDALRNSRVDDPATPNTGAGEPPYAERGAMEFRASQAPVAVGGGVPPAGVPLVPRFSPSPVRAQCDVMFFTTRAGPLEVGLYDLSGRRVRELVNDRNAPAGTYRLSVRTKGDGGDALPSGIYFVRVRAAEGTGSGRFALTQ